MNDEEPPVTVMADAIAWFFGENDTPTDAARAALLKLREAGYEVTDKAALLVVRGERDEAVERPNLGLATTRELLDELRARIEIDYFAGGGGLDYTTVGGRPDSALDGRSS